MQATVDFPHPLPDDPKKWEGWKHYKSSNYYDRLCLDPHSCPSNELIEEHCRELLRWWQKKLPLKNQPSNPITQLLRPGLDESSRFLTEARVELLDPERRREVDEGLAALAQEAAVAEFRKYVAFAIADGFLTLDEEKNLLRFGREQNLTEEQMLDYIEQDLTECGARRVQPAEEPEQAQRAAQEPREEFLRMLRLSGLDSDGMSDDARDALINMAENLGLNPGDAEDMVDDYLDEADQQANSGSTPTTVRVESVKVSTSPVVAQKAVESPGVVLNREVLPQFTNSLGGQMIFVPTGEFVMGSEAADAAPNERPLTRVALGRFFMSRFPITNADYEQFDRKHADKRAAGADDRHPAVYVSSLEAMKFCAWLGARERKKYRLPTEAEWEYAARGTDGRKYPWGERGGRGDLANFADKNTVFAWSDRNIDDGYAETSPVGAYPMGVSPFGIQDMAGNVWEWCQDYFESYRGAAKINPRGATAGTKRVYRGGSWKSRFNSLRTTARGSNASNYSCNDLGFRVVCECD